MPVVVKVGFIDAFSRASGKVPAVRLEALPSVRFASGIVIVLVVLPEIPDASNAIFLVLSELSMTLKTLSASSLPTPPVAPVAPRFPDLANEIYIVSALDQVPFEEV